MGIFVNSLVEISKHFPMHFSEEDPFSFTIQQMPIQSRSFENWTYPHIHLRGIYNAINKPDCV